ncbi:C40 family peptidase [candidate division KSB1 bacterium]|nr:C40 family peptidase [candidate division KSB1 bacterium]RQW06553.1 MAG: NlpC/P60 family protein [candidate division KSB1 bacterium]
MKKTRLFFLLLLALLLQCAGPFAPRPYYSGMHNQISYDAVMMEKMKEEIRKFYGAPYKWGGDSPQGTDCSGLIATLYKNAANITLPHSTQEMFAGAKKVHRIDLLFGDLVFFSDGGRTATHVGLYIGKGYFLHASSSRGVILSKMTDRYYRNQFIGARRIEIY